MIEMRHVSFSYSGEIGGTGGVRDISMKIKEGEFVVLCGESGCGKTTITRLINGLIPHYYEGQLTGTVCIRGKPVSGQPLYELAKQIGSVFQNPRSQFFNVDTDSELAFGCENLGMEKGEIVKRMEKAVTDFHLEKLLGRSIFQLSGGEKQKIACAGVAAMQPDIFVLDEPSSNLDAAAIDELREILSQWKRMGKTVMISEHRLYYLMELADRFVYLKNGRIEKSFTAKELKSLDENQRIAMGLRAFSLGRLQARIHEAAVREFLSLRGFQFSYKGGAKSLCISDCEIPAHQIVAIIGDNGAGKSTFSRCFCGLEKRCGDIVWKGKRLRPKDRLKCCYMVMQEVNHQLFTESVLDEIIVSIPDALTKNSYSTGGGIKGYQGVQQAPVKDPEILLEQLDLLDLKERHPMSLSGGQKQRVAIASAMAAGRSVLFFDEPTSGLDYRHMTEVAALLRRLQQSGQTVYVITHDLELLLDCCTSVIHFRKGEIAEQYPMDEAGVRKIKEYFLSDRCSS